MGSGLLEHVRDFGAHFAHDLLQASEVIYRGVLEQQIEVHEDPFQVPLPADARFVRARRAAQTDDGESGWRNGRTGREGHGHLANLGRSERWLDRLKHRSAWRSGR